MDHKVSEDLPATLDHRGLLETLDCWDHQEIQVFQVHWDLAVQQVQWEILETLDTAAIVEFKVPLDQQDHWDHKDLKDRLGSKDRSGLQDRQVEYRTCCYMLW